MGRGLSRVLAWMLSVSSCVTGYQGGRAGTAVSGVGLRRSLPVVAGAAVDGGGSGVRSGASQLLYTKVVEPSKIAWRFTRPHTFLGTALSVPALHAFAAPSVETMATRAFAASIGNAMAPVRARRLSRSLVVRSFDADARLPSPCRRCS